MARTTTNYLNNRDLLIEIHKSKTSYCQYEDPKFAAYDAIIYDLNVLSDDKICMKINKKTVKNYIRKVKKDKLAKILKENPTSTMTLDDILTSDLVFRFMTFSHIPLDESWPEEKTKKYPKDGHMKVNFPPFQHYIIENGIPRCVGLSHHKNSQFDPICGKTTNKLGMMYMLLVEKISKKGNWRNYSYIDEMKSSALLQLSQVGLQFDEGRGQIPNPFAFYTTVVSNAFKRILNIEKSNRDIRDDLIEMSGQNPSFSRQLDDNVSDDFYSDPVATEAQPEPEVKKSSPGKTKTTEKKTTTTKKVVKKKTTEKTAKSKVTTKTTKLKTAAKVTKKKKAA